MISRTNRDCTTVFVLCSLSFCSGLISRLSNMCFQVTCDNCRKKTWKGKQLFYFKIIRQTVEKYGKVGIIWNLL